MIIDNPLTILFLNLISIFFIQTSLNMYKYFQIKLKKIPFFEFRLLYLN